MKQQTVWRHTLLPAVLLLAFALPDTDVGESAPGFTRVTFPGHHIALMAEIAATRRERQIRAFRTMALADSTCILRMLDWEMLQGVWIKDMHFPPGIT